MSHQILRAFIIKVSELGYFPLFYYYIDMILYRLLFCNFFQGIDRL